MNWEKLKSSARATSQNHNFPSLCELGKAWKCSLRPNSKTQILDLLMNWEKLCPDLSSTVANKMGNLRKTGRISNLTWWLRHFILNFKNLPTNWEKYVFNWKKRGFWLFKMPATRDSEVNETILEKVKVAIGLWLQTFQFFFKKQKLFNQN